MTTTNMTLWDSVSNTDPKYTKLVTDKPGQNFTAISPQYQRMVTTKALGPMGIGWGIVEDSEVFEHVTVMDVELCNYKAKLFYILNGKEARIPLNSTIKFAYTAKSGRNIIDDDYRKKVATDALTKGLSFIGVSADVFMGMFDDSKYVFDRSIDEQVQGIIKDSMKSDYIDIVNESFEEDKYPECAFSMHFFDTEIKSLSGHSTETSALYMACIDELQTTFEKGRITAYRKQAGKLRDDGLKYVYETIARRIEGDDRDGVTEVTDELSKSAKNSVFKMMTQNEKDYFTEKGDK